MSNFLAIATVTAALSQVLLEGVVLDVSGADVTTVHPNGEGGTLPAPGVNVFLYQVTQNAAWHNADLPARRGNGDLIQRPQAAVDLHYLLTFYGDESLLEPQRVLGSVVRTLHARPVLTRDLIRRTIAKPEFLFLVNSNLADAVELVKFTPVPLSLEELSKLWSVYFQTTYSLSAAYQGTVVLIESEESTRAALPVRARNIYVVPFRQPLIERVRSAAGEDELIFSGSTIVISGQRLRGDVTRVRVGGLDETPAIGNVSDTQVTLPLPANLRAGVQGLQVVQLMDMGTPLVPHKGVESNLAAFVIHPTIRKPGGTPDITLSALVTDADGMRSGNVTVKLSPTVSKKQRAVLLLSELIPPLPPSAVPPRAYSFDSAPHNKPADPEVTDTLVFPISRVKPAEYLVRVQVDGADSPLETSADVDNPLYIGPKVTI